MNARTGLIAVSLIAAASAGLALREARQSAMLREQRGQLSVELAHTRIPLRRDTIRDTIEVVTQIVVEVDRKELKDALAADRRLIKELRLRIGQLEAMQTTALSVEDSVAATYDAPARLFTYSDEWATLRLSLEDTTFYYNVRDSLATVVSRQYRHRLLWLKWGTKGYEVKIVNYNPHTHVTYNRYIKAGK